MRAKGPLSSIVSLLAASPLATSPLATLAVVALVGACSVADAHDRAAAPPPGTIGTVAQATLDDKRADVVAGQPDFVSGAEPSVVSSSTLHRPLGLATNSLVTSPYGSWVFVADTDAHRVVILTIKSLTYTNPGVFGQANSTGGLPNRGLGTPSATSLDTPAAIAFFYDYDSGDSKLRLAIADRANHRVMAGTWFGSINDLYGQSSWSARVRNDGGVGASSLAEPSGVAIDADGGLYVADTGNHRVLFFPATGSVFPAPDAEQVVGQKDFKTSAVNRGGTGPTADSLDGPTGIAAFNPFSKSAPLRGIYVADTENHRVLHFAADAIKAGAAKADIVYGQLGSFTTATPANGGVSASSLKSPRGVTVDFSGGIYIADTGHHRVLHFRKGSTVADRVYGQPDFTTADAPPGFPRVSAKSLYEPSGVAEGSNGDLYVADSGASRVLRYRFICAIGSCDDGDPCTDDFCDASTGCSHQRTTASAECAPYQCDLSRHVCRDHCAPYINCAPGYTCSDSGTCYRPCGVAGDPCLRNGICVDGVCCNTACTEVCAACNLPGSEGTCAPATGGPPQGGRKCPFPDPECAARLACGADPNVCIPANAGTACGFEFCRDGVATMRGGCDGGGPASPSPARAPPMRAGRGPAGRRAIATDTARQTQRASIIDASPPPAEPAAAAALSWDGDPIRSIGRWRRLSPR